MRWEDIAFPGPHEHAETSAIARAYAATGNESYAGEAVARILGWAARVPPPPRPPATDEGRVVPVTGREPTAGAAAWPPFKIAHSNGALPECRTVGGRLFDRGYPAWQPGPVAERLLNWGTCLLALRPSRAFTPEAASAFLVLVHESAEFLRSALEARAESGGPAPQDGSSLRQGAALAVTAALFGEFTRAGDWRLVAGRVLEEAVEHEILSDGCEASRSLGAHERALEALVAATLALEASPPPGGGLTSRVAPGSLGEATRRGLGAAPVRAAAGRAAAFESAVVLPDGRLPYSGRAERCVPRQQGVRPGRADWRDPGRCAERLATLALARDLLGVGDEGPAAEDLPYSRAFPEGGFFVMRTGPGPVADYLLLRAGRECELLVASCGASHGKAGSDPPGERGDRPDGSRGEEGGGSRLATEGTESTELFTSLSSVSSVAGRSSEEPDHRALRWPEVELVEGPPCDYLRASGVGATDGVGQTAGLQRSGAVECVRQIIFVNRRYWVIGDRLSVNQQAHACSLDFAVEGGAVSASADGRRFAVRDHGGGDAGLLVALAAPTDTGFRLERTEDGGTVARARAHLLEPTGADAGTGEVLFVALVYPLRGEDPESISVEPFVQDLPDGEARAVGIFVRLPEGEHLRGFPGGFPGGGPGSDDPAERVGPFPLGVRAAALSRTKEAAEAGGGWTTLFEAR